MTKQELLSTLSTYLNKEVRRIIREELEQLQMKNEVVFEDRSADRRVARAEKPSPKKITTFSKNSLLNDILTETANEIPDEIDESKFDSLMEEKIPSLNFNSGDAEFYSNRSGRDNGARIPVNRPVSVKQILPEDRKHVDNIPDFLEDALTRDYSGFTKSLAAKKRKI